MHKMSKEAEAMLQIVEQFMHPNREKRENYIFPEDFDALEKLYRLSLQHKLEAAVYEIIHEDPLLTRPENQMLALSWKQMTLRGVLAQVQRTQGFLQVYQKLCAQGIRPLIIKGGICRKLYERSDARISGDEDILIREEDFARCDAVMLEEGFHRQDLDEAELPYEIQYLHPRTGVYIEVHLSLFPEESGAYGHLNPEFSKAHETCIAEEMQGVPVWTLEPTLHLFYLICHSLKHFLHSGFGIRQLCDMVMMAEQYDETIDWMYIYERLKVLHMTAFWEGLAAIGVHHLGFQKGANLTRVLQVLQEQAGKTSEEAKYWPLLADLLDSGIYGDSSMERKHSSNITLTAAESGKKDTAASIRVSLFPKMSYMKGRYTFLKPCPWLLPVAWCMRIIRYLVSSGRRKYMAQEENADNRENSMEIGMNRVELLKQYGLIK